MSSAWTRALGPDGWARSSARHPPIENPREREVGGRIGSSLFLVGGVLIWALSAFSTTRNAAAMTALGVVTFGTGAAMLAFIPWARAPKWTFLFFTLLGIVCLGCAGALMNGVDSPALLMGAAIITFAGTFLMPRVALGCVALVALVTVLPIAYGDPSATAVTEMLMTAPIQLGLGIVVILGAARIRELAASQQQLAREQAALLGLAKDVASDAGDDGGVFFRAAQEAAELLGADGGLLMRIVGDDRVVVIAGWSTGLPVLEVGTVLPAGPGTPGGEVWETEGPVLFDMPPESERPDFLRDVPFAHFAVAPVRARGRLWGLISVATAPSRRLPADAPDRLASFADLVGTAVMNREAREQLVEQASRDPLTGLLNHRSFHEQLRTELARAQRYGRELSLVVLDVDHFKSINDAAGHDVGDDVLAAVAERLQEAARTEDTMARIGGDEFAMLLPETDGVRAFAAIERARALIAATPVLAGVSVTISAGICDLRNAQDADTMFRLADGALYWSKAHGRDATWIYDPDVVRELSAAERAEQLRRSQALLGIRALARAIDAKDPSTRRHSERVAALSRRLAEMLDWEPARVALLEEAALVHDVGKIGVPDAVLLKPGRLTTTERHLVGRHAELGAQIVEDVLTEEQVEWIHSHHERPDGQGYPRGLSAAQISMGAAILTVADSFDVMTMNRPYSDAKPPDEAIAECEGLVGRQFAAEPVEALVSLHASGELAVILRGGGEEPETLGSDPAGLPPTS